MGAKKGWPDFLLVAPSGGLHCLELKREGEKLSPEQEAFQLHCVAHGIPFVVAYSVRDALVAFDVWDCLEPEAAG
jgi:VRR-NUC domain